MCKMNLIELFCMLFSSPTKIVVPTPHRSTMIISSTREKWLLRGRCCYALFSVKIIKYWCGARKSTSSKLSPLLGLNLADEVAINNEVCCHSTFLGTFVALFFACLSSSTCYRLVSLFYFISLGLFGQLSHLCTIPIFIYNNTHISPKKKDVYSTY